jgi:hypothetical protein
MAWEGYKVDEERALDDDDSEGGIYSPLEK